MTPTTTGLSAPTGTSTDPCSPGSDVGAEPVTVGVPRQALPPIDAVPPVVVVAGSRPLWPGWTAPSSPGAVPSPKAPADTVVPHAAVTSPAPRAPATRRTRLVLGT